MARALLFAMLSILLSAAPAQALSPYAIFFEPGSARLTDQARAILNNAVIGMNLMAARKIEIIGGADRTGSVADNLALSRRRAEVIRDALRERGISSAVKIEIVAAGESQPIVDTEDGVAEAQNRYGLIVLISFCSDLQGRWICPLGGETPQADN
jgi:OmpA-OmpF porin, OOP family